MFTKGPTLIVWFTKFILNTTTGPDSIRTPPSKKLVKISPTLILLNPAKVSMLISPKNGLAKSH